MDYFSAKENFFGATNIGIKILRKQNICEYDYKSQINILNKLDISFNSFLQKKRALFIKEWSVSKLLYEFNQQILKEMDSIFKQLPCFLSPRTLEELGSVRRYNSFVLTLKPYIIQTGYLQNDIDPSIGRISNFNYSGDFAFDYRLRSLGADLKSKKQVQAIRLRNNTEMSRVKPSNLSLWTSQDNIHYLKYDGNIIFSYDSRSITLYNLAIDAQYLKIHCNWEDYQYTFSNNFDSILSVYGPGAFPAY